LYQLREERGEDAFPKSAIEYLNNWADDERGWLRKFYPAGDDEPHFELTPATEKALGWLASLAERQFVGTESRLRLLFDLLRQIRDGSQPDPDARIRILKQRRAELDSEIERIESGDVPMLDNTALKERFQQFDQMSRELLSDFREVESNFRMLDRQIRERIATWEGGKGELLEEIMGKRQAITDSDQGRSFQAFWDYIMSPDRQDELRELLGHILDLPPLEEMTEKNDNLHLIHNDWLSASEYTQATVRRLSEQFRNFLDGRTWLENRRIMDLLHQIEANALEIKDQPPRNDFMEITSSSVSIELPFERPLYKPPIVPVIESIELDTSEPDIDNSLLFNRVVIDKAKLKNHINQVLMLKGQTTLKSVLNKFPLNHGLAEILMYLQLAAEMQNASTDDTVHEFIEWESSGGKKRRAKIPRILFVGDHA
jgi:hypothetical protein